MILNTKFELGDIVTSVLDDTLKMQIIKISIYLDGGYQYEASRLYEGQLLVDNYFERELEEI